MRITKRRFVVAGLLTAFALLMLAAAVSNRAASHSYLAFVGTYTNKTDSKGIYAFQFDVDTGKLSEKGVAAQTPDPSWVVIHPNGKFAYAANEAGKQSTITAFAIDPQSAKLTPLNQVPAQGEDPCHLSFDKTGKYLFAANYSSGTVAVFPIQADGKLGEHTAAVKNAGEAGPNHERQEGPHAHWAEATPNNKFLLVADLGLDGILIYKFDASKGTLTANDPAAVKLAAGAGPRHAALSPDGKFLYVISELNSTVTTYSFDVNTGASQQIQVLSTLPPDYHGRNDTAEIMAHPAGKWLFASNRGHDSIAVFSIERADGKLHPAGTFPTGGKEPRHFAIDPSGHFLLVENQNTNSITVFRINYTTGALTHVAGVDGIPSPVCMAFLAH
jgi:6-phosphogluconolactonase